MKSLIAHFSLTPTDNSTQTTLVFASRQPGALPLALVGHRVRALACPAAPIAPRAHQAAEAFLRGQKIIVWQLAHHCVPCAAPPSW